jgi:hypothetical protein
LALIAAHIDMSRWDPSNALNMSANQPWSGIICRVMERYDRQFKVVFDAIRELMSPTEPPKKRRIGFGGSGDS